MIRLYCDMCDESYVTRRSEAAAVKEAVEQGWICLPEAPAWRVCGVCRAKVRNMRDFLTEITKRGIY